MPKRALTPHQIGAQLARIPEWDDVPRPGIDSRMTDPFGSPAVCVSWIGNESQGFVEAVYSARWMSVTHGPARGPSHERAVSSQADFQGVIRDLVAKVFGKGVARG